MPAPRDPHGRVVHDGVRLHLSLAAVADAVVQVGAAVVIQFRQSSVG